MLGPEVFSVDFPKAGNVSIMREVVVDNKQNILEVASDDLLVLVVILVMRIEGVDNRRPRPHGDPVEAVGSWVVGSSLAPLFALP